MTDNLNELKADSLRPARLEGFIGKEKVKRLLSTVITGARVRGEPLDHVLLTGGAGLGKTTLANIIANELGAEITTTIGNNVDNGIIETLQNLKRGDVLFVDEIHAVPKKWQEVLYPALEDGKASVSIKDGNFSTTFQIQLPKFTLIGATTEAGLLAKPLRDRFGLTLELEPYTLGELILIVGRNADKLGLALCDCDRKKVLEAIAERSRGTPRIANHLLRLVRDFLTVSGEKALGLQQALEVFKVLDIRDNGVDNNDLKVLTTLERIGQPLGVGNLSANSGLDVATIEKVVEPFLLSNGLIARTGRGRTITEQGKRYLKGGGVQ